MLPFVSGGHSVPEGWHAAARPERTPAVSDIPSVPPSDPSAAAESAPSAGAGPAAGPAAGSGAGSAARREPDPFGRLLRSVGGRDWLVAVLAGASAWVAAYVVAALSLLLTVVAVGVSGSGSASLGSGSLDDGPGAVGSAAPDLQSLLSGISVLLGAPAQLVALADLGRLHVSGSVPLLGVSGAASLGVVPALVLAAQVVPAVVITRRMRSRSLALPQVLLTSAVTGLVLTAFTSLAALALAIRFPRGTGATISAVHAVGVGSVLGAFVVGALAALLARPSLLGRGHVWAARALGTVRVAVTQVGMLVVLVTVVIAVVALVAQPSWGPALPLLVGNVALAVVSLGFLGGLGVSGFGNASDTVSVFDSSGWLWLVVLLVVLTAVAAGLALAVRRNDRARTTLDWVVSPAAWLLVGLVAFVLGTGVVSYDVSGARTVGGAGSVGVAPWTPVVFALWGAAIEAVARYLAPLLLPRLGGRLLLVTARLVGSDPSPVPAWGVGGVPAGLGTPGTVDPTGTAAPSDAAAPSWNVTPTGSAAPTGAAAPAGSAAPSGAAVPSGAAAPSWAQGPAGGPAPFIGADAASAVTPMSPRTKRVLVRSLVAAGAVVVVVVAGAVTTGLLRSNVWGPAPTVRSYVDAIAAGDAATAERMSELPDDAPMLTSAVLRSAEDRPRNVRVGRVTTTGDQASAVVSYTQGGKNRSGQVELRRTGTSWLVKDEWRVTTPLAESVSVSAVPTLEGAPVTVGGKRVGTIRDGSFRSLAYPGSYTVRVGGSEYFTGGTKTVSVGASGSGFATFTATPTKKLTKDAEAFVADAISACAAKTSVDALRGCPWYGPYDAEGAVEYEVTKQPALRVVGSGSGSVQVTSTSDGVVEYDYTTYSGKRTHGEDTFDVYEFLKVEDGELVSPY
jgi:hypothetical protein